MKYDQIGKTYNQTRMPDPRITDRLTALLTQPVGATILDIGAGTGNYSYELAAKGYQVIAVEPSETMRAQAKQHERLVWTAGFAEELPLDDDSADGIVCTLATHHFRDLALSFQEMARVVKKDGKIVIFTADPRICLEECWIADYFREIVEDSCLAQPDLEQLRQMMEENTGRSIGLHSFPLPSDLKDKFFFNGWRTPDAYLDETYRAGISSLAGAPTELVAQNVEQLREDLASGKWHERYGHVLELSEYDCGYFFLVG
jgi:SAM-dependent methyltransferase